MDYSSENLNRIEELARQLTPASEISALLELPTEDDFLLDIATPGHPARIRYLHGLATTANDLRRKNLELADACAPSAIEQCFRDMRQMQIDLNRL